MRASKLFDPGNPGQRNEVAEIIFALSCSNVDHGAASPDFNVSMTTISLKPKDWAIRHE